jgi:aldehyde dehydrogenase (NAD+)
LGKLVSQYLDSQAYTVVQGAIEQATTLLDLPWGHIFFTGSTRVGRIVAEKAAKFVTPMTLELGSKSPAVVDPECDIELAAKRIMFGKYQTCGQV